MPLMHDHGHTHEHGHLHAHPQDAASLLRAAEQQCLRNGSRLTAQRRDVLEALAGSEKPLGAYDLIEKLREKNGRAPAPIAVYRALDFLKEQSLIHRLETLNAFVACPHHHAEAEPVVFLICETCRTVEEAVAAPLNHALAAVAQARAFTAKRQVVELAGTCKICRAAQA